MDEVSDADAQLRLMIEGMVDELIERVQAMGGDIAFLSAQTLGDAAPLTLQTRY